jgi:hypothetical protein
MEWMKERMKRKREVANGRTMEGRIGRNNERSVFGKREANGGRVKKKRIKRKEIQDKRKNRKGGVHKWTTS